MNILYVAKLTNDKLQEKLVPILYSSSVDHIYVLRDTPGNNFSNKVTYLCPRKSTKDVFRHVTKIFKGLSLYKKLNINIVVGVLNTPHGYIGKMISLFTHRPYIHVTIAGDREFWVDGKLKEIFNCWFFKNADFITVTGSKTYRYLLNKNFISNRIVILPNIPNDYFLNLNDIPLCEDRPYDLVFISRIDRNKNLELLLKALSKLKSQREIRTLVVGDGEELDAMNSLATSLKTDDRITFSAYVSSIEDKVNVYKECKIFVSTSKGEGFPVSLLEAMCCGCVPVVSNVGDISDAIEQGVNGYVFNDTNDETELAHYLCKLFDDRMKMEAMSKEVQKIKDKLSVNNNTKIWDSMFSKITELK
jgi:glycosyltransferase involved in cell wall biosynthesis